MAELYKDPLVTITLSENPVAVGHLEVRPNKNVKTLQDLENNETEHLFFAASYAATALFELAGAQGTNIIVHENDLVVHVIARKQDDGLNFLWEPTQGNPAELQELAKKIKDTSDIAKWNEQNPSKTDTPKETTVISEEKSEDGKPKKNWLLGALRRSP